jgi:hypothetical protein
MPKEIKVTRHGKVIFRAVFRDLTPEEKAAQERQQFLDNVAGCVTALLCIALLLGFAYLKITGAI